MKIELERCGECGNIQNLKRIHCIPTRRSSYNCVFDLCWQDLRSLPGHQVTAYSQRISKWEHFCGLEVTRFDLIWCLVCIFIVMSAFALHTHLLSLRSVNHTNLPSNFNTLSWKQLLLFGGYNLIKQKNLWLNF